MQQKLSWTFLILYIHTYIYHIYDLKAIKFSLLMALAGEFYLFLNFLGRSICTSSMAGKENLFSFIPESTCVGNMYLAYSWEMGSGGDAAGSAGCFGDMMWCRARSARHITAFLFTFAVCSTFTLLHEELQLVGTDGVIESPRRWLDESVPFVGGKRGKVYCSGRKCLNLPRTRVLCFQNLIYSWTWRWDWGKGLDTSWLHIAVTLMTVAFSEIINVGMGDLKAARDINQLISKLLCT